MDILHEVYLAPNVPPADIGFLIAAGDSPWAEIYKNAPHETVSAVSSALHNVMLATRQFDPAEIDIFKLDPDSRFHSHVEALLDIWRTMGNALPLDLQVMRHVIYSDGYDSLKVLPIIDTLELRFVSRAKTELRTALVRYHRVAEADALRVYIYLGASD